MIWRYVDHKMWTLTFTIRAKSWSNDWVCGRKPHKWPFFKRKYFPVVLFIMLYKVVLTFESVGEILKCDHSNESYWAVFSYGAVYYAVQGGSDVWVCEFVTIECDHSNKSYWVVLLIFLSFNCTTLYLQDVVAVSTESVWSFICFCRLLICDLKNPIQGERLSIKFSCPKM